MFGRRNGFGRMMQNQKNGENVTNENRFGRRCQGRGKGNGLRRGQGNGMRLRRRDGSCMRGNSWQ